MKINIFYLYIFLNRFVLFIPFTALYLLSFKGLNNNQISIFLSIYGFSIFALEIPTGIIADRIGENKTLVLGNLLVLLSYIILHFSNSFFFVLSKQFVDACGYALCSGATSSLLYKYVSQYKNENEYKKILSHFYSFSWLGLAVSFVTGFFIVSIDVKYILLFSIYINILVFIISIFLPKIKNCKNQKIFFGFLKLASKELSNNKKLIGIIILTSVVIAINISAYMLLQIFLEEIGMSGAKNGLIYFVMALCACLGSYLSSKIINKFTFKNTLYLIICIFLFFIFITICFVNLYLVFFCFFLLRFLWGFIGTLSIYEINTNIKTNDVRSTILSLQSLLVNLFQGSFLVTIGLLSIPMKTKYIFFSLLLSPIIIYLFLKKKSYAKNC